MVYWPELSHSDPLILEYLTHNSWNPDAVDVIDLIPDMCRKRYGEYAADAIRSTESLLFP